MKKLTICRFSRIFGLTLLAVVACCASALAGAVKPDIFTDAAGTGLFSTVGNWSNGEPNSDSAVSMASSVTSATDDINTHIYSLSLATGQTLNINNGITLTILGSPLQIDGNLIVGGTSGSGGVLEFPNATLYEGTGSLFLSNGGATIAGEGALDSEGDITAFGGNFSVSQFTNQGTMIGASPTVPFVIKTPTINNTAGTINAVGHVTLDGSTISGGAVTTGSAGEITAKNTTITGGAGISGLWKVSGNLTLDGAPTPIANSGLIEVPTGSVATLVGTVNNADGEFFVDATKTGTAGLVVDGPVTVDSGLIKMSNSPTNSVFATGSGASLTLNGVTFEGSGNLGSGNMSVEIGVQSTVLADQSTPLVIQPNSGGLTNNGMLEVGTGDTLHISDASGGGLTNFSGTTLTGGAYNVSGTLEVDSLGSSGGEIETNAATIILNGTGASIVDAAGLNALSDLKADSAAGTFSVKGANSLDDSATVFDNAGTLTVGTGSGITFTSPTATFTQTGGTTTVDGTLTAQGGITFSGGSVFGNGGTFAGNTTNAGAVFHIGDKPKTAGTESITGDYTQSGAGVLDINIGGTTAGTQFDQLNITGSASLNGTLNLALINSFVPTVGETFDFLNATGGVGSTIFLRVNGTVINSSEDFSVVYNPTNVTLDVVSGGGA